MTVKDGNSNLSHNSFLRRWLYTSVHHGTKHLGLCLEDDVPDHSILSRFRTRLTAAGARDKLLEQVNQQIQAHNNITITKGCHVDAGITQSPRKPRPNQHMISLTIANIIGMMKPMRKQPCTSLQSSRNGVNTEVCWVKRRTADPSLVIATTLIDHTGLVLAVETQLPIITTANCC